MQPRSTEPQFSLSITAQGRQLDIRRRGQEAPLLTQHAGADRRPYIHPLLAPDGIGSLTEDAPSHHPWQHGLYVGLNGVNGIDFWKDQAGSGTFHPAPITEADATGDSAQWAVETTWRDPDGAALLVERQGWTLRDAGAIVVIDLDWQISATTDLTFEQYAYGGLFLRMPYRPALGGVVLTSERLGHGEADGQRARWAAVAMPIAERQDWAGVAILDHPTNPEHPVPWRIDRQFGISPSRCIAGAWHLSQGATAGARYRLIAFSGTPDASGIEAQWRTFTQQGVR